MNAAIGGADVCVISVMRNGSYDGLYPDAELRRNKLSYCARCGYRCMLLNNTYATNRSAGWDKLLAIRDAFLKWNCSLALWLDADIVVLRAVQLQSIARTSIVGTRDFHGFNTGFMLLARSQASR